jgi:hypothetical protein
VAALASAGRARGRTVTSADVCLDDDEVEGGELSPSGKEDFLQKEEEKGRKYSFPKSFMGKRFIMLSFSEQKKSWESGIKIPSNDMEGLKISLVKST